MRHRTGALHFKAYLAPDLGARRIDHGGLAPPYCYCCYCCCYCYCCCCCRRNVVITVRTWIGTSCRAQGGTGMSHFGTMHIHFVPQVGVERAVAPAGCNSPRPGKRVIPQLLFRASVMSAVLLLCLLSCLSGVRSVLAIAVSRRMPENTLNFRFTLGDYRAVIPTARQCRNF